MAGLPITSRIAATIATPHSLYAGHTKRHCVLHIARFPPRALDSRVAAARKKRQRLPPPRSRTMKQAPVSSTVQGGGKRRRLTSFGTRGPVFPVALGS